jgi:hypothetical protein
VGLGTLISAVFANSKRRNDYGNRASDGTSKIYEFGNGSCQRKVGCFIGFSQVEVL